MAATARLLLGLVGPALLVLGAVKFAGAQTAVILQRTWLGHFAEAYARAMRS